MLQSSWALCAGTCTCNDNKDLLILESKEDTNGFHSIHSLTRMATENTSKGLDTIIAEEGDYAQDYRLLCLTKVC